MPFSCQHHLAHVLARLEVGVGGRGLFQREGRVDHRFELAGRDPRPDHALDLGGQPRLLVGRAGAQGRAGDRRALLHDLHHRNLQHGSGQGGDVDDAAAGVQGVEVLVEIAGPDHVQHHVDPAGRLGDLGEVLGLGVDGDVGAQGQGLGLLVGAAAGGDHPRAVRLGHGDRRCPDTGRPAMNQKRLANLERAMFEHIGEDREHGLGQGGGVGEVETLRDGQGVAGVDHGVLGVAAAAQQGADLVAGLPASRSGHDLAGDLQAQGGRRAGRRRVEAQALQQVRTVHPGRPHADQDLAGPRPRARPSPGGARRQAPCRLRRRWRSWSRTSVGHGGTSREACVAPLVGVRCRIEKGSSKGRPIR
jgi:hypothetical protein